MTSDPVSIQPQGKDLRIGELLVGMSLISNEHLKEALIRQQGDGLRLGEVLVSMKVLKQRDLSKALSEQLGIPFADLRIQPTDEAVAKVPEALARALSVVPMSVEGNTLSVALAHPLDPDVVIRLAKETRMKVRAMLALASDIRRVIDRTYPAKP